MNENYKQIINHYNNSFDKYGFTLKGLNWKSLKDNNLRFKIVLEYLDKNDKTILDYGCGTSFFYKFLKKKKINILYSGLDTNKKVIEYCKNKYPKNKYFNFDILEKNLLKNNDKFDVILANGLFTQRLKLKNEDMYKYLFKTLLKLKYHFKKKLVFNLLFDSVDWKNSKNFYVSLDKLLKFLRKNISKKVIFRLDYSNNEMMVIVFK